MADRDIEAVPIHGHKNTSDEANEDVEAVWTGEDTAAFFHEGKLTPSEALDRDVAAALSSNRFDVARSAVAAAEALLSTRDRVRNQGLIPAVSRTEIAAAKARIVAATGDMAAAHAILVQAIERYPDNTTLKTLMSEMMLARGRASDVRPILQHLGRKPSAGSDHDTPMPLTGETKR